MVQDILSSMSSDEVNSVDDTFEATQVANIIRSVFYSMVSNRNWPQHRRLIQVDSSGDAQLPTHMYLQEEIKEIVFVNYDKQRKVDNGKMVFKPIKYLDQDDFMRVLNMRNQLESNISTIIEPVSQVPLLIRNDIPPTYYTSFDEKSLVFDSYDKEMDDIMQKHKIQVYAYVMPEFLLQDRFIPDLPSEAFMALLEESKSRAFMEVKQQANQKAEQESQRQQKWLSRKAWTVKGGIRFPNYGRVGKTYPYVPMKDPTFRRDE
jgi:hypothetical protein